MPRGLLDMPEVVMNKIMEDINIKAILRLRKVCHSLRNYINDIKPEANLEEITVIRDCYDPVISIRYQFSGGLYHVEYKKQKKGCLVKHYHKGNGVLLKNEDFMTVSMKDFEIVLRHQKSVLKEFALTGKPQKKIDVKLLKNLQRILKSRDHPLKIETFNVEHLYQNEIISILSLLDSNTLCELEIWNREKDLEVDQLVKLDQWKNIKHMTLDCCIDFEYIRHFTHFSTGYIRFRANYFPDLILLKDLFLQSPRLRSIEVSTRFYLDEDHKSIELLGEPLLDVHNENCTRRRWYYHYPATNQILQIFVLKNFRDIKIELIKKEENHVPENAVIQN